MNNPAAAYKNTSFEAAPPLKILRMLYAGALRFIDRAAACDPRDPTSQFVDLVYRAEAIVTELHLSLEAQAEPEFVERMGSLYDFVSSELQQALVERSVEPLDNARAVLAKLADAWSRVEVEAVPGAPRP